MLFDVSKDTDLDTTIINLAVSEIHTICMYVWQDYKVYKFGKLSVLYNSLNILPKL